MQLALILLAVLTSLPAPPGTDVVLLPVSPGAWVTGANGTIWMSELTVYNAGNYPVRLAPLVTRCPPFECPAVLVVEPGTSSVVPIEEGLVEPSASRFVYAEPDARNLHFNLRAFAAPESSAGASIPVVRLDQTFITTVHLLGVPSGPNLRSTLRVYDLDPTIASSTVALVRVFDTSNGHDELVASFALELSPHVEAFAPGYGAVHNLQEIFAKPLLRYRVEVDPPPGKAIWAFVATVQSPTEAIVVTAPDNPYPSMTSLESTPNYPLQPSATRHSKWRRMSGLRGRVAAAKRKR